MFEEYLLDRPVPTSELLLIEGLRHTPRTGWADSGIARNRCETSWQHSLDLKEEAGLYQEFIRPELGRGLMLDGLEWHDANDYYDGDIPPQRNIPRELRKQIEWYAVQKATSQLGARGERIRGAWQKQSRCDTPESFANWQLDKIATLPRMIDYRKEFPQLWERKPIGLQMFIGYVLPKLTCPTLYTIAEKLLKQEYPQSAVQQYHLLLRLGGNIKHFDQVMTEHPDYLSSTVNNLESCTSKRPVRAPASSHPWA